jgi:monofunctional biosynthetic peptidoglycan transglycosylase
MSVFSAADRTLLDFSSAADAAWQVANDDVMGGVSTSRFDVRNGVAVFRGEVSLENDGGFASVRSSPVRQNLSGLETLVLRVRGDGRRYKFTARTESGFDAPVYQCAFTTKRGEWEEHRLPSREFVPTFRGRILTSVPPLNATRVVSVGFLISDKQAGPFKLEIAWIKAARSWGG